MKKRLRKLRRNPTRKTTVWVALPENDLKVYGSRESAVRYLERKGMVAEEGYTLFKRTVIR